MRILITGATGFVGGWLADDLAAAYPDVQIWGTAHGPAPAFASPTIKQMRVLDCDITNKPAMGRVLEASQPDFVFHLAGFASGAGGNTEKIFAVNVGATVGLLELLQDRGKPCRVQLASSGYVYGATPEGDPATESTPTNPVGAYAESKAAMENAARPFATGSPLSILITRAFNHTGPRQNTEFVIPAFARQIARIEKGWDEPIVRVGNLEARRDFLHVRDVVRAYRLLLCEEQAVPPWRVVNVCSGRAVQIQSLLDGLLHNSQTKMTVETDPDRMRPSDLPECVGSHALLTKWANWQPETPLGETLRETLEWWRTVPGDPEAQTKG